MIPAYRAAGFIRATLDSVAAQTVRPAEVVVVDDASPDDTAAVVERWAASAPLPVRLVRLATNSGGPARPLNVGIAAARGDLIAPLDHDDAWPPDKLADQLPLVAANPDLGLVFGGLVVVGPDAQANGWTADWFRVRVAAIPGRPVAGGERIGSADATLGVIRARSFVGTCSNMLFPKAVWRAVGGFDEGTTVSCDLAFLAAVAARYDLGRVPSPSAVWTFHPASMYRTASEAARVRDQFRVYARLARRPLPPGPRSELRRAVHALSLEGSWRLRLAGDLSAAAACLARAAAIAGPWPAGAAAAAGVLRAWAARAARRVRPNQPTPEPYGAPGTGN